MNIFEVSIKVVTFLFLVGVQQQCESADHKSYFVVIDAGFSSTKVQVFEFLENNKNSFGFDYKKVTTKRTKSSFVNEPSKVKDSMKELLDFAKQKVPKVFHTSTYCIVRISYQLELIPTKNIVVANVHEVLRKSPFKIPIHGAQILSGREEALYSWVSINILTKTFQDKKQTYPLLQIVQESLQFVTQVKPSDGKNVTKLKLSNGDEYYAEIQSYPELGQLESLLRTSGYKFDGAKKQVLKNVCLSKSFTHTFLNENFKVDKITSADITDSERPGQCRKSTFDLIKKFKNKIVFGKDQPIYCTKGAFYVMKNLAKKYPELKITKSSANTNQLKHSIYSLTEKTLEKAARIVCPKIPTDDSYWPFYCLYINVMTNYLRNVVEAEQAQSLKAMGDNDAIGWPLGLALNSLVKYSKE